MRLTKLEGKFIKLHLLPADKSFPKGRPSWMEVPMLAEADGVQFLCPKCYAANNGPVGTHSIVCWFAGKVPDWLEPNPGRWHPSGTGLDDLTFIGPGSVSVALTSGCMWHGFVKSGDAA